MGLGRTKLSKNRSRMWSDRNYSLLQTWTCCDHNVRTAWVDVLDVWKEGVWKKKYEVQVPKCFYFSRKKLENFVWFIRVKEYPAVTARGQAAPFVTARPGLAERKQNIINDRKYKGNSLHFNFTLTHHTIPSNRYLSEHRKPRICIESHVRFIEWSQITKS